MEADQPERKQLAGFRQPLVRSHQAREEWIGPLHGDSRETIFLELIVPTATRRINDYFASFASNVSNEWKLPTWLEACFANLAKHVTWSHPTFSCKLLALCNDAICKELARLKQGARSVGRWFKSAVRQSRRLSGRLASEVVER